MSLPSYKFLTLERRGRVLYLTINRPEQQNAVNEQLHGELAGVFSVVAEDPESDVVVLTGAGTAFSAGGDIDYMRRMLEETGEFEKSTVEAKRILNSMLDMDKPLIGRINGHAIGLGATLALMCDVTVAVDTALFIDPHVHVGLAAGDGGALIWPQLVGYARAKEFLLTGASVPAPSAAEMGLINYSVPEAELDAKVDDILRRLARGSQQAIRLTKASVNVGLKALAQQIIDTSIANEIISSKSADHAKAVAAFLEGKRPKFD